jgi:hypothetical protein
LSPPSLSEASMTSDSESTSGHGLNQVKVAAAVIMMTRMMALAKLVARHGELRVTVTVSTQAIADAPSQCSGTVTGIPLAAGPHLKSHLRLGPGPCSQAATGSEPAHAAFHTEPRVSRRS